MDDDSGERKIVWGALPLDEFVIGMTAEELAIRNKPSAKGLAGEEAVRIAWLTRESRSQHEWVELQSPDFTGRVTFDLHSHLNRQYEFSQRIFGPGTKTASVLDHIRKELVEIEKDPLDLEEWVDVIILALDGAMRTGRTSLEVIEALIAKQTKNEKRKWPDWRTIDPDKAIEHDRSEDEEAQ